MKKYIYLALIFSSIILVAAAFLYFFIVDIAVFAISKNYDINVSYKKVAWISSKQLFFTDLKIVDNKRGVGLFSKSAKIKFLYQGTPCNITSLSFDLFDLNFITADRSLGKYDSLTGLVQMAFSNDRVYKELSGTINPNKAGIVVKDLAGRGDDVKVLINGAMGNDNTVDGDCTLYFSSNITGKIPKELTSVILNDEPDGWASLSVHVAGDSKTPSISVSSKLFRLNIRGMEK